MSAMLATTLNTGHAGMTVRSVVGLALSVSITAGLFWLMPYLIEVAEHQLDEGRTLGNIEFVRVKRDEEIRPKDDPFEKPTPPEPQPPAPEDPIMDDPTITSTPVFIPSPPVDTGDIPAGGFGPGLGEGDYLPIVKVAPVYPQRALSRGIEGYCVVEYTVTPKGTIRHPVVIESQCTSSLFHKSSIDAARKFKYKPRVIDGVAVQVPGVRNRFTFRISE